MSHEEAKAAKERNQIGTMLGNRSVHFNAKAGAPLQSERQDWIAEKSERERNEKRCRPQAVTEEWSAGIQDEHLIFFRLLSVLSADCGI